MIGRASPEGGLVSIIKGNSYTPIFWLNRELITLPLHSSLPLRRVKQTQKAALDMIYFRELCEMGLNGCWKMSGAVDGPDSNGATEWTWKLDLYGTIGSTGRKSNGKTFFTIGRWLCIVLKKLQSCFMEKRKRGEIFFYQSRFDTPVAWLRMYKNEFWKVCTRMTGWQ